MGLSGRNPVQYSWVKTKAYEKRVSGSCLLGILVLGKYIKLLLAFWRLDVYSIHSCQTWHDAPLNGFLKIFFEIILVAILGSGQFHFNSEIFTCMVSI